MHSYFPLSIFFNSAAQNNSSYLKFYIYNALQTLPHTSLFSSFIEHQGTFSDSSACLTFSLWDQPNIGTSSTTITAMILSLHYIPKRQWISHKLFINLINLCQELTASVSCSPASPNSLLRKVSSWILTSQQQHSSQSPWLPPGFTTATERRTRAPRVLQCYSAWDFSSSQHRRNTRSPMLFTQCCQARVSGLVAWTLCP